MAEHSQLDGTSQADWPTCLRLRVRVTFRFRVRLRVRVWVWVRVTFRVRVRLRARLRVRVRMAERGKLDGTVQIDWPTRHPHSPSSTLTEPTGLAYPNLLTCSPPNTRARREGLPAVVAAAAAA